MLLRKSYFLCNLIFLLRKGIFLSAGFHVLLHFPGSHPFILDQPKIEDFSSQHTDMIFLSSTKNTTISKEIDCLEKKFNVSKFKLKYMWQRETIRRKEKRLRLRLFSYDLNSSLTPIKDVDDYAKVFAAETKSSNKWKLGLHPFLVWPQSMTRVQVLQIIWCWGNWCKGGCIFLVRMQKPFQKFISSAAGHTRANLGFILILFTNISISFVYYSRLSWTGVSGLISNSSLILVVIAWGGISKVERPWK